MNLSLYTIGMNVKKLKDKRWQVLSSDFGVHPKSQKSFENKEERKKEIYRLR
jgi:hypothetical protein